VPSAAEAGSGTPADPVPALVTSGRCEDHGLLAVTSADGCSSAAAQLALSDTSAYASPGGLHTPPYCYTKPCNPNPDHQLFYIYNHSGPGNCTSERACICSVPPAAGSGTPVSSPNSAQTPAEAICPYDPGEYITSAQFGLNVECTFFCGSAKLPGYPTDMSLHLADCSSIRADNCTSPFIELANELYAPQTWLGVFVAYFFIYNALYTMKEKKFTFELTPTNLIKAAFAGDVGAIQEIVLIATVLTGFCNAVIASWKTTSKFGSMFDVGRCFFPHPYDEGSVISPTTLTIGNTYAGLFAFFSGALMMISSPQIVTIVRQALILPIMYWIARFGRNSQYGNRLFAFCALANFSTFLMACAYLPLNLAMILMLGGKNLFLLPFAVYQFFAFNLLTGGLNMFVRFWYQASAAEKRPMWLRDGWFGDDVCPGLHQCSKERKARSKRLFESSRQYFRWYLFFFVFFQSGVLLPNQAAYSLVVTHNAGEIRWTEFADGGVFGKAYGSFFGNGLRIPQFYWAEYFGNFDTILGHLALAFGIDLFLIVQNVLPQAGSTFDTGAAARVQAA